MDDVCVCLIFVLIFTQIFRMLQKNDFSSSLAFVRTDAARITHPPRDQRVIDNGVVSFFCRASGNPAPEVYWQRAGRRIASSKQRYVIGSMPHGSFLRIEPVKARRDDTSAVECVADNQMGHPAVAAATLTIYPEGLGKA